MPFFVQYPPLYHPIQYHHSPLMPFILCVQYPATADHIGESLSTGPCPQADVQPALTGVSTIDIVQVRSLARLEMRQYPCPGSHPGTSTLPSTLCRCAVALCPAWTCVAWVVCPSHPGTPTAPCDLTQVSPGWPAWTFPVRLIYRHTNPPLCSHPGSPSPLPRLEMCRVGGGSLTPPPPPCDLTQAPAVEVAAPIEGVTVDQAQSETFQEAFIAGVAEQVRPWARLDMCQTLRFGSHPGTPTFALSLSDRPGAPFGPPGHVSPPPPCICSHRDTPTFFLSL